MLKEHSNSNLKEYVQIDEPKIKDRANNILSASRYLNPLNGHEENSLK